MTASFKPSALPRLRPGAWVALDTEDSGLYPDDGARVSAVSVAWFVDDELGELGGTGRLPAADDGVRGVAFPFGHGAENQPWFSGTLALFGGDDGLNLDAGEWEALRVWLSGCRIVMHNGQYDNVMMGPGAGVPDWAPAGGSVIDLLEHEQWDTMLGCKNLWPVHAKGLGPTAERLKLGKKLGDPVKDWIRKNKAGYARQGYPEWGSGYDLVPWDLIMEEYAAVDAVLTLKVFRVQRAAFLDGYGDWVEFCTKQMPLMKQFVRMERRGMPYPRERSLSFVGLLEDKQGRVAKGLPFTPNAEAARRFFFTDEQSARGVDGLGLIPVRTGKVTKKWPAGTPALDAEILGDFAREDVPAAAPWKLYTDLGRLSSMYYEGYAEKTGTDGRLRARIRQIREATNGSEGMADRLSIERVNLQAMPHDRKLAGALEGLDMESVRHLMAWEIENQYPGWEAWELDLSQAELRVGALLSGCTKMLEAFANGEDLHQNTADAVGVSRQTAKMSNFLLIFDGGSETFRAQVKKQTGGEIQLTAAEAKQIVFPWKRMYPQFKKQADIWERHVNAVGYVPLANGQLRWFTDRERQWDARKGWNQRVQGSIQQLFQLWLLQAEAICESWGVQARGLAEGIGGAGPLMTVHDSIICFLPGDVRERVIAEIQAAAITLWDDMFAGVPGAVDAKQFG